MEALRQRGREAFSVDVSLDALESWVNAVTSAAPSTLDAGLVLACALFHRVPNAQEQFEAKVVPRVRAALTTLGAAEMVDEHVQAMRTRLLVDDAGSRLKHYRGVGAFEAFVITTAVRSLTDAHRGPRRNDVDDEPLARMPAAVDLEKQLARSGQAQFFAAAFKEALATLTPRERALLKLNLVDGASIDELGPLYQVSRATVARWLATARQSLQRVTLERLSVRTKLDGGELDGLMASLASGFDVSLRRFVTEATSGDE